jgi:hypothetical protein
MAKSAKVKKTATVAPEQVELRIVIDPNDAAPVYYVNFMEVANTPSDFSLLCVRLPPKLSDEKRREVMVKKEFHAEPDVILTFPTSIVPGLIRALTTQKENYEKAMGLKIQEPGVLNE